MARAVGGAESTGDRNSECEKEAKKRKLLAVEYGSLECSMYRCVILTSHQLIMIVSGDRCLCIERALHPINIGELLEHCIKACHTI